ncbi:hypothetical protein D3C79_676190 [compost metagenome]
MLLQHLTQQHMLAAKVITVRGVPCLTRGFVQQVYGDRQAAIGLRVVGVDLDVHGFACCRAQMGEGADDAEAGFLMVGCRAKSQVDELWTRWLEGLHGRQDLYNRKMNKALVYDQSLNQILNRFCKKFQRGSFRLFQIARLGSAWFKV